LKTILKCDTTKPHTWQITGTRRIIKAYMKSLLVIPPSSSSNKNITSSSNNGIHGTSQISHLQSLSGESVHNQDNQFVMKWV
jgi:hypothetical protein